MQRAIEYLTACMRQAFEAAKRFDTEPIASREEDARIRDIYLADAEAYSKSIFALREAPVEPETKHVNLSRFRECLRAAGVDDPTISKVLGALAASMRGRMVHAD